MENAIYIWFFICKTQKSGVKGKTYVIPFICRAVDKWGVEGSSMAVCLGERKCNRLAMFVTRATSYSIQVALLTVSKATLSFEIPLKE